MTALKDRLRLPDQPIAQQGIHTRGYSEAKKGGTHHTDPAMWWITNSKHDCHSYGYHKQSVWLGAPCA
jgi:hypothetical protein